MANKKSSVLRMDAGISDALERWAVDEFRSMNGQIEYILSQALKNSGRFPVKNKIRDVQKDSTGYSSK